MAGNSYGNNAIVLAVINFIYLMLSVILLAPATYWNSASQVFSGAYGSASAVYSFGVLYSFFEKALSPGNVSDTKMQRIVSIIGVLLATLNIGSIVLYYFVLPNYPCIIVIGYFFLVATAALALFKAAVSALEFIDHR